MGLRAHVRYVPKIQTLGLDGSRIGTGGNQKPVEAVIDAPRGNRPTGHIDACDATAEDRLNV